MGIFSRIGDIIKSNISDLKNDEKTLMRSYMKCV